MVTRADAISMGGMGQIILDLAQAAGMTEFPRVSVDLGAFLGAVFREAERRGF